MPFREAPGHEGCPSRRRRGLLPELNPAGGSQASLPSCPRSTEPLITKDQGPRL